MVLRVYAIKGEASPEQPAGSQATIISGRPGWLQEASGEAVAPYAWRATAFAQGVPAYGYSYTFVFDCVPPGEAGSAQRSEFVASCQRTAEAILAQVEILREATCRQGATPTTGPLAWRQVSDDWYRYAFEVPSGWLETDHVTGDRCSFLSDPGAYGQPEQCPLANGLMKLDLAVDPPGKGGPDLRGWRPFTVGSRQAWLTTRSGDEAGPGTFWISAYIEGPEYHYLLSLGCTPPSPEASAAYGYGCQSTMDHILESFRIKP